MEALSWRWLAIAALLGAAVGETIVPANFTTNHSDPDESAPIKLSISEGNNMIPLSEVLGLTSKSKSDIPPVGISGIAFLSDSSTQMDLKSDQIAIISCDPDAGYLSASEFFDAAAAKSVQAVLFYSKFSDHCDLQDYSGSYQWIYSMMSKDDSKQMLQAVQQPEDAGNGQIYATIGYPGSLRVINGTTQASSQSSNNKDHKNPLGPSPTTAVAMIILYSITGLITALFLIIIVTGAYRAHRHPERYGPQGGIGMPRQSRAKGLARAMLDTLPIVKFGEREEAKTTDVELNGANSERQTPRDESLAGVTTARDVNADAQPEQISQARQSVDGGIAAATDNSRTDSQENLGCSICTEDFEAGQDQRVLPCDHRFHPECVDPWLLNVSGTCPLCRIDLRPTTSRTSDSRDINEDGHPVLREGDFEPPPLGPQETAGERQRMTIRRSIALGLMGIGRPDRLTREERVLALRQLRGQQLARRRREEQASVVETPEEERSTRRRLRDVLGIRTRRTGQQRTDREQSEGDGLESREELGSRSES